MTLARPMLPPVDPTRRRFLTQAAAVAGGGAVLALATVSPALAKATPASLQAIIDGFPALKEAARALDDANDVLISARAAEKAIDDKIELWIEAHPYPQKRRAHRRWSRWAKKVHDESGINPAREAVTAALGSYQAAQVAVAKVKPRDLNELALKATISVAYENGDTRPRHLLIIGRSVAWDACRLAGMLPGVMS
jgi:hypothetical protein